MGLELEGRLALVTGGSRGIGAEISFELARAGANVLLMDRTGDPEGPTIQRIRELGRNCRHYACDVSDLSQLTQAAEGIGHEWGPVHILVNNAGITRDGLLLRLSSHDWDEVIDINLKGAFHCARTFAKGMVREKWGRIVNVTSVIGLMGNVGQANYAASKAGLIGLTKSVAKELATRNITANAIAPGYIDTPMTVRLPEKVHNEMLQKIPMKCFGTPRDVAHLVAFLASERGRYITGQVISVDGGLLM